jgi:hypothetical protein
MEANIEEAIKQSGAPHLAEQLVKHDQGYGAAKSASEWPPTGSEPGIATLFYVFGLLGLVISAIMLIAAISDRSDAQAGAAIYGLFSSFLFFGIGFGLHRLDLIARKVSGR